MPVNTETSDFNEMLFFLKDSADSHYWDSILKSAAYLSDFCWTVNITYYFYSVNIFLQQWKATGPLGFHFRDLPEFQAEASERSPVIKGAEVKSPAVPGGRKAQDRVGEPRGTGVDMDSRGSRRGSQGQQGSSHFVLSEQQVVWLTLSRLSESLRGSHMADLPDLPELL